VKSQNNRTVLGTTSSCRFSKWRTDRGEWVLIKFTNPQNPRHAKWVVIERKGTSELQSQNGLRGKSQAILGVKKQFQGVYLISSKGKARQRELKKGWGGGSW